MQKIFFKIILITTLSAFYANVVISQTYTRPEYKEYAEKYSDMAIKEMGLYKIPASITLAQGIIESNVGRSLLATEANNHFGIKCHKEWTGDRYSYDDDEKGECFRKYSNVAESFRDHSLFLTTRDRYAILFTLPINDYKAWAKGLKAAGYATNPQYADILIKLIEENQLHYFDDTLRKELIAEEVAETKGTTVEKEDENKISPYNKIYTQTPQYKDYIGKILFKEEYTQPEPEKFELFYVSKNGRNVYKNYGKPFIFAEKGDTWESLAKEFNLWYSQIYKQNDMARNEEIAEGQILYLAAKNKRNVEKEYFAKEGDSMYSIAQEKCIKLSRLYKYNDVEMGKEPLKDTKVYLDMKRK